MFIGIKFTTWLTPVYVVLSMISVGLVFSGVGLFLSTIIKSGQTFQIVKTAIVLPLTFISGAYIPLSILPSGLKYVAYFNPMTYATAFFRMVVLEKTNLTTEQLIREGLAIDFNGFIITPFLSFGIIMVIGLIFLVLSTISFTNTDFSKINRGSNDGSDIFG